MPPTTRRSSRGSTGSTPPRSAISASSSSNVRAQCDSVIHCDGAEQLHTRERRISTRVRVRTSKQTLKDNLEEDDDDDALSSDGGEYVDEDDEDDDDDEDEGEDSSSADDSVVEDEENADNDEGGDHGMQDGNTGNSRNTRHAQESQSHSHMPTNHRRPFVDVSVWTGMPIMSSSSSTSTSLSNHERLQAMLAEERGIMMQAFTSTRSYHHHIS